MSTSSKSKVIVLAALQKGISVSAVAKRFGVSRRWVHILLARYRKDSLDALAAKSTAPKTHPHAISGEVISKHTIGPEKNYWVKKREIKNK